MKRKPYSELTPRDIRMILTIRSFINNTAFLGCNPNWNLQDLKDLLFNGFILAMFFYVCIYL